MMEASTMDTTGMLTGNSSLLMTTGSYNTSWMNGSATADNAAADSSEWNQAIEYKILEWLETYISPSLFFLAIIGNGLAFAVFATKEFRYSLTAMLYMILAVADTLVVILYDGLHSIPSLFDISIITRSTATCKLFTFSYFTMRALAAMILVVIGLERFIGVLMPHRARIYNTKSKFLVILGVSSAVIIANYAPLLSSVGIFIFTVNGVVYGQGCSTTSGNDNLVWYGTIWFQWSNLALSTFIPFALILIINVSIIFGVLSSRKMRMKTSSAAGSSASTKNTKDSTMTLIYMLLTVSFAFIIFTIPYPIYFFLQEKYALVPESKEYARVMLLGSIAPILDSLNHSINIFMYCICGQKFRLTLLQIITFRRCRNVPTTRNAVNGRNHGGKQQQQQGPVTAGVTPGRKVAVISMNQETMETNTSSVVTAEGKI